MGFRVPALAFGVDGSEFRVWSVGFVVWDAEFWFQGVGFRMEGLGACLWLGSGLLNERVRVLPLRPLRYPIRVVPRTWFMVDGAGLKV